MTLSLFGSYKWCDKYGNWHSGYPSDLSKCYTLLKCDWWGNWYNCTPPECPKLDGIVEGTSGNDVIDLHYTGDPDGDRIDDNDAILAGAGSQDDVVYGFGGNDNIQTFAGNDLVYGGSGDDVIDDAAGANQGEGSDTFFGDSGNDKIWGGVGNDKLYGGADNDYVDGEEGNDLVDGGTGNDTLFGGAGHDTVLGGAGTDIAYGGAGNDFIDDALGADQGTGKDTFFGGAGDDVIWGGLDDDKLFGGDGNDFVGGEEGNDHIQGNGGADKLFGGTGDDIIYGDTSGTIGTPGGTTTTTQTVSVGMTSGQHTFAVWELSDINVNNVGWNDYPFPDSATGEHDVVGSTFTIKAGAAPTAVGVNDDDNCFNDGDLDQKLSGTTTLDGHTEAGGERFTPEYAYSIKSTAGVVINVYAVEFDGNNVVGFITDKPLDTSETYTFLGKITDHPSISYDKIASTYTTTVTVTDPGTGGTLDPSVGTQADGADHVFGGAGDDKIYGGGGDDRLYGDNGDGSTGSTPVQFVRESFEWSKAPDPDMNGTAIDDGDNLNGGFTQNTGNVDVTFSVTGANEHPVTTFETEAEKVHSITTDGTAANPYSSMDSLLDKDGEKVTYNLNFSEDVKAVSFRINDIDNASVVQVYAYDMNGNRVPVDIQTGTGIHVQNNDGVAGNETLISNGANGLETDPTWSALVNIAGPISRIEIVHTKVQSLSVGNDAGINVTDIYFDAPVEGTGGAIGGNDHIVGGLGNDIIAGEAGNDVLEGNAGRDVITGGAGNDTINAGAGDEVNGSTAAANGSRPAADYQNVYAGGAGNDTINGGAGDDIITGDDDSRASAATGETFQAGADGSDTIFGGAGNDEIHTGSWADGEQGLGNVQTGVIGDLAYGGDGDDIVLGAGGNDNLFGDAGNDRMNGGAGNDNVYGGTGNDAIDGGAGSDALYGGDDRDTITAGAGDTVDGGTGGDDFDVLVLDGGVLYVNTGPGGTGAPVLDADGDSFTGRVVFVDANGVPTGEFIDYTEIEEIRGGTPFNGDPDAVEDNLSAGEDAPAAIIGNVLTNDTDPNGDPLTVGAVNGSPANVGTPVDGTNGGSFTINPDGTVTFDPAGDFNQLGAGETATTTVSYTVSDGKGGTDTATVTVTVTGANDAPVAVMDTGSAGEDTIVPLTNVLANDTDPDTNDTLSVAAVNGSPANVGTPVAGDNGGLVTINPDGSATFDPNGDFEALGEGETATTTVSYTVSDGKGGTDTTTVTVTVTGTNDAPVATNDTYGAQDAGTQPLGNVLANDTDPDSNDTLTVAAVNGSPANVGQPIAGDNGGLVTINPDGSVSFDPNGAFDGLGEGETATTSVTYTVDDGNGGTDTATVTITVSGTNDGPTAVADTFPAGEDDPAAVIGNVLANDTDPNGDPLTVGAVNGSPANVGTPVDGTNGGSFTINPDGTVTFDPAGDFNQLGAGETATTTVSYTVSDGKGGTDTATVTVTVTGANDAPVAVMDTGSAGEDTIVPLTNVLANDTDPDTNDTLSVAAVNGSPANVGTPVAGDNGGLVTINPDGSATFDPNGDFEALGEGETATTTVSYTVSDGKGGTDTTTVTVTVTGTNDAPVATNNTYTVTSAEGAGDIDGNVITDNTGAGVDSDPEGDTLTVVGVGQPLGNVGTAVAGDNGGLFTINADGTVDFDANGDFDDLGLNDSAVTSVTYTISDGNGGTSTATASFTVGGTNDGTVFGTDGNDVMNPGYVDANGDIIDGNDAILPGDVGNDDLIYGLGGNDTINAGNGNDEVYGGTGNDSITGGNGNDTVSGDAGNDIVRGGNGDDTVYGDDGDDSAFGGDGDDVVFGGAGNDTVNGNAGNDELYGGEGDDVVAGQTGDDTLYGDAGNDLIQGDAGSDLAFGGEGDDVIDTSNHVDPGFDNPYPGLPGDLDPTNDRDTVFGGNGNDTITTGDDADSISGGAGNDTIDAGIDNDVVDAGTGNDTVIGGEGVDVITGGDGDDLIYGGLVSEQFDFVDFDENGNVVDLAPDNNKDTIFGGAGNDTIYGRDDADSIQGGTGDDLIYGGNDDDTIAGNMGNDTIYGDQGNDTLTGSRDDDLVYGGTGDDFIQGGSGFDTLYGDEGNDIIQGGLDNDTIFGGAGNDTVQGGGGDDFIDGGAGDDLLKGSFGQDTILGGEGTDTIQAEAGNDIISSGDGADKVFGGLGSDRFTDASSGDVIVGGEDPDDSDIDTFNFDQATLDKIDRIVRNGGAGDSEALRESGTIYFKDGTTATFREIEAPCFTPGTTIATPKGEVLVEDLRAGDKVITRDNGIQEIAWVGSKEMTGKELAAKPHMKPILIKAGALGQGLPERDMLLSPNHRVLVASEKTQLYFEEREVLAAAKHMTGAQGIHTLDVMRTTYIHFMFERHEVVLSNGAWTESFHPGDYSLNGLGNSQRNEIFELFPELATAEGLDGYQSARKALKKHEARLLMK